MKIYDITVNYVLSSKKFYDEYLKDLQSFFRKVHDEPGEWKLRVDFSGCRAIEGNVIPNLFVTGYIVKENIDYPTYLCIQPGSKLSSFLQGINFYYINREQQIFELFPDTSEDRDIYELADYCRTTFFDSSLSEADVATEIVNKYSRLFGQHLEEFVYLRMDEKSKKYTGVNIMEVFCKQICYNSIFHEKVPSYVTMQANYANNVVLISFADYGEGLYKSIQNHIIMDEYTPVEGTGRYIENIDRKYTEKINVRRFARDFMAILECVLYRFGSDYGIWLVFGEVMRGGGIIRFHTGRAKVSFSGIDIEELESCSSKENAFEVLMKMCNEHSDYVRKTPYYTGTHIEIELPMHR
jgi:hypothetical protein